MPARHLRLARPEPPPRARPIWSPTRSLRCAARWRCRRASRTLCSPRPRRSCARTARCPVRGASTCATSRSSRSTRRARWTSTRRCTSKAGRRSAGRPGGRRVRRALRDRRRRRVRRAGRCDRRRGPRARHDPLRARRPDPAAPGRAVRGRGEPPAGRGPPGRGVARGARHAGRDPRCDGAARRRAVDAAPHLRRGAGPDRCSSAGDDTGDSLLLLREVGELRLARERERGGVSLEVPEQKIVTRDDGSFDLEVPLDPPGGGVERPGVAAHGHRSGTAHARGRRRRLPRAARGRPAGPRAPAPHGPRARHRLAARDAVRRPRPHARLAHPAPRRVPQRGHVAVPGASYEAFGGTGQEPGVPDDAAHAAIGAEYAHVTAPLRRLVDRYGTEVCLALCAGRTCRGGCSTPCPACRAPWPARASARARTSARSSTSSRPRCSAGARARSSPASWSTSRTTASANAASSATAGTARADAARPGGPRRPAVRAPVEGADLPLGDPVRATLREASVPSAVSGSPSAEAAPPGLGWSRACPTPYRPRRRPPRPGDVARRPHRPPCRDDRGAVHARSSPTSRPGTRSRCACRPRARSRRSRARGTRGDAAERRRDGPADVAGPRDGGRRLGRRRRGRAGPRVGRALRHLVPAAAPGGPAPLSLPGPTSAPLRGRGRVTGG